MPVTDELRSLINALQASGAPPEDFFSEFEAVKRVCRLLGEEAHPKNFAERAAIKTDEEFPPYLGRFIVELAESLLGKDVPAEEIKDLVPRYLSMLIRTRSKILPDPSIAMQFGRKVAILAKIIASDFVKEYGNTILLIGHSEAEENVLEIEREHIEGNLHKLREAGFSLSEIKSVPSAVQIALRTEIRKRATHTPAQGEGTA